MNPIQRRGLEEEKGEIAEEEDPSHLVERRKDDGANEIRDRSNCFFKK
jgi:hypothetical protein